MGASFQLSGLRHSAPLFSHCKDLLVPKRILWEGFWGVCVLHPKEPPSFKQFGRSLESKIQVTTCQSSLIVFFFDLSNDIEKMDYGIGWHRLQVMHCQASRLMRCGWNVMTHGHTWWNPCRQVSRHYGRVSTRNLSCLNCSYLGTLAVLARSWSSTSTSKRRWASVSEEAAQLYFEHSSKNPCTKKK